MVVGERGPTGDHGQGGDPGAPGATGATGATGKTGPRGAKGGFPWLALLGYFIFVAGVVITVGIVLHQAKETDQALCRGQRANSQSLIELLEAAQARLRATPVDARPRTYESALNFYEEEIAKREAPLECEVELGL